MTVTGLHVMRLPGRPRIRSVRTEVDGIAFASKREAKRYGELKLLEKVGVIRELKLQPRYTLYAGPRPDSPTVELKRICEYRADFEYQHEPLKGLWLPRTEDAKGMKTQLYLLKKKLFEAQYCRQIHEV